MRSREANLEVELSCLFVRKLKEKRYRAQTGYARVTLPGKPDGS